MNLSHTAPQTAPPTAERLLGLSAGQRVLAVVPHPDDETLGIGGFLHRASKAGLIVNVLAVTCPGRPMWDGHGDPMVRSQEFEAACDVLGVSGRLIAWIDDDRARNPGAHLPDLVALIESGTEVSLAQTQPDLLLIPSATAFHQDHLAVHQAGIAAARLGGTDKPTPRIVLGYRGPEDIWSPTMESWPVLIDTTTSWPVKQKALSAHASQLRSWPHPRSIEAIHALDAAAGLRMGATLAEAFVAYRLAT